VHVMPVARRFIETMAAASPFPTSTILRGLLDRRLTEWMLDLLRSKGRVFDPVLHNTVNATIVRGGEKINVIPSEVTVELDGRLLPGYTPADMIAELRELVGEDIELAVIRHDPAPPSRIWAYSIRWPASCARLTRTVSRFPSCSRPLRTHDPSRGWASRPTASCR
jgi:acetylornithine deacetylase/succinyl-diaminopimelate desuccinylase-like protein